MERDKLIAEWGRLVGKPIYRQLDEKIERGRPQSGNAEAARQPKASNCWHLLAVGCNWWASGGHAYPLPGKLFHRKLSNTLRIFRDTIIFCAHGYFVKR